MTHDPLALPDSPLAREVLDLVNRGLPPAIRNHSVRSFVFARLVADHRELQPGRDYDLDLLFCACALHDIGVGAGRGTGQRFEVAGADIAAELLTRRGAPAAAVDAVWQAIALNTAVGVVERRGIIPTLTLGGVVADFIGDVPFVSDETAATVHAAYPRLQLGRALGEAIVAHVAADPARAPLFSAPAQIAKEYSTTHTTVPETLARSGRWGE